MAAPANMHRLPDGWEWITDQLHSHPLTGGPKLFRIIRFKASNIYRLLEQGGSILSCKQDWARSIAWSGANILALRERVGMTQLEFAAALGISPNTVHRSESGKTTPSKMLCIAFDRIAHER